MINKWIASILLACTLASLVGCNTVQGVGKDIEKAGQSIENVGKK